MVRWMRWQCLPDTWFEIRTVAVLGQSRYFSVTEAPRTIESLRVRREGTFVSLKLECQSGVRTGDLRLSKQTTLTTTPGPPRNNTRHAQHAHNNSILDDRPPASDKSAISIFFSYYCTCLVISNIYMKTWQGNVNADVDADAELQLQ